MFTVEYLTKPSPSPSPFRRRIIAVRKETLSNGRADLRNKM